MVVRVLSFRCTKGSGVQPFGSTPSVSHGVGEVPLVCQNVGCRSLQRKDGLELKSHRYWHQCSRDKKSECVPVRFVSACKRGHVDEFPWITFVHAIAGISRCASPTLEFEEGPSRDFNDIFIKCTTCGGRSKLNQMLALLLRILAVFESSVLLHDLFHACRGSCLPSTFRAFPARGPAHFEPPGPEWASGP